MVQTIEHTYKPKGAARDLFYCRAPEVLLDGPAGCVSGDTRIYDSERGDHIRIDELCELGLSPMVMTICGPVRAGIPFLKGITSLRKVVMKSGLSVTVTGNHLFLTEDGWQRCVNLSHGQKIASSAVFRPPSNSERDLEARRQGVAHSMSTAQDSMDRCSTYFHPNDARLQYGAAAFRSQLPSQCDVLLHNRVDWLVGDRAGAGEYSRTCQPSDRLAMLDCFSRSGQMNNQSHLPEYTGQHGDDPFQHPGRLLKTTSPARQAPEHDDHSCGTFHTSCDTSDKMVLWDTIDYTIEMGVGKYYDLTVPGEHHYLAEGIWHHNTGKSRAWGEYINTLCEEYENIRVLVLRKTRASLTESFMVTFEEKVLTPDHPALSGPSRLNRHSYTYPTGSEIVLAGMDQPTRIFSSEYDLIYVQEATELTESEWESLHRALRNGKLPWQQLGGDCNPDAPSHWLNQRCLAGKTQRLLSRHKDNPSLTESYLLRLQNLSGVRRARLFEGRWAAAEGIVYASYDAAVHCVDQPPTGIRFYVAGVDWGFTNPGVILVAGMDGDGRCYIVEQVYHTGKTIDWWVAQAQRLGRAYNIQKFLCDPAEPAYILDFTRGKLKAIEADNDILPGIGAVEKRFKPAKDGRPRLFFCRDSMKQPDPELQESKSPHRLEQEIESYVWPDPKPDRNPKEVPVDNCNHAMDALRYLIRYLDPVDKPPADPVNPTEYAPGTYGHLMGMNQPKSGKVNPFARLS